MSRELKYQFLELQGDSTRGVLLVKAFEPYPLLTGAPVMNISALLPFWPVFYLCEYYRSDNDKSYITVDKKDLKLFEKRDI